MKCPKCGKDVLLQNKKVGVDADGNPIFNEYAVCKDCRKQWNLDKQRARKSDAQSVPPISETDTTKNKKTTDTSSVSKKPVPEESSSVPRKRKSSARSAQNPEEKRQPATVDSQEAPRKKRPASPDGQRKRPDHDEPAQTVRRKREEHAPEKTREISLDEDDAHPRYSNIPSEKIREKREHAVRKNYEEMLSSDPERKSVHKRRPEPVEDIEDAYDDYEDEYEDYEVPRFRVLRVIFGILSILSFLFFAYKGVITGLDSITSGSNSDAGMTYILLALCMLISGLLLLILQKRNNLTAFLIPFILYLAGGVFSFIKRGDDKFLLYGAAACGVLSVIFLLLTILSRFSGDDEEDYEDYDDPFEEDHDNY